MKNVRVRDLCFITFFLLSGCGIKPTNEAHQLSAIQYETQMTFKGGLVELPVSVNGTDPKPLILDTGFNSMILSQSYANEVGAISSGKTFQLRGVSGDVTGMDVVRNLLVDVGGLQWGLTGAMVAPRTLVDSIATTTGRPFHGMLGSPMFEQYVVTIDFQTQKLQLSPSNGFEYGGGGERLKLSFKEGKPYIKALVQTTPQSTPVEGEFLLDLGSNQSFDLKGNVDPSLIQGFPLRVTAGIGGEVLNPVGRIHALTLGTYRINNPVTSFESPKNPSREKLSGRIGTKILSQFKVIFNYANQEVFLEPLGPIPQPIQMDMSGLRLKLDSSIEPPMVTVDRVYPNTPAAEAGIQAGDRILDIDGQTVDGMELDEIRSRFIGEPATQRQIGIQRQEERRQIQINLRLLI